MTCYFVLEVQKWHTIILVSSKDWIKTWLISCLVFWAKWADGIYFPPCLKSTYLTFNFFSITPFLPYLMLALISPVYLLLTDKTNGACILMIIKRHFDDYIHKKHLSKRHNRQVDIYFSFCNVIENWNKSCLLSQII